MYKITFLLTSGTEITTTVNTGEELEVVANWYENVSGTESIFLTITSGNIKTVIKRRFVVAMQVIVMEEDK